MLTQQQFGKYFHWVKNQLDIFKLKDQLMILE